MSLDKLKEQYERETGNEFPVNFNMQLEYDWYQEFVEWLANRPTCGVEQRKFLDEIERDWSLGQSDVMGTMLEYSECQIYQSYMESDLSKVVKGE